MATYRYEITLTALCGQGELPHMDSLMVNYPQILRWKYHATWRATAARPSITMNTLVDTGPGVNKADLDQWHLNLAADIKAMHPTERVVVSNIQVDKIFDA